MIVYIYLYYYYNQNEKLNSPSPQEEEQQKSNDFSSLFSPKIAQDFTKSLYPKQLLNIYPFSVFFTQLKSFKSKYFHFPSSSKETSVNLSQPIPFKVRHFQFLKLPSFLYPKLNIFKEKLNNYNIKKYKYNKKSLTNYKDFNENNYLSINDEASNIALQSILDSVYNDNKINEKAKNSRYKRIKSYIKRLSPKDQFFVLITVFINKYVLIKCLSFVCIYRMMHLC